VPEDIVLGPEEALAEAQRLLDAGYPFHAHEVLEGAWKTADVPDRGMWKGLAQLAVGLTHLQRGNTTGAVALLRRGIRRTGSTSRACRRRPPPSPSASSATEAARTREASAASPRNGSFSSSGCVSPPMTCVTPDVL
jgi:hypothetical protein